MVASAGLSEKALQYLIDKIHSIAAMSVKLWSFLCGGRFKAVRKSAQMRVYKIISTLLVYLGFGAIINCID